MIRLKNLFFCKYGCDRGVICSYSYNEYDGGTPEYEPCQCWRGWCLKNGGLFNWVMQKLNFRERVNEDDIPF